MLHAVPTRCSTSLGGCSFVPDEQALYLQYDYLSMIYPGWTLTEIRLMTRRQRSYWLKLAKWKREKSLG